MDILKKIQNPAGEISWFSSGMSLGLVSGCLLAPFSHLIILKKKKNCNGYGESMPSCAVSLGDYKVRDNKKRRDGVCTLKDGRLILSNFSLSVL